MDVRAGTTKGMLINKMLLRNIVGKIKMSSLNINSNGLARVLQGCFGVQDSKNNGGSCAAALLN